MKKKSEGEPYNAREAYRERHKISQKTVELPDAIWRELETLWSEHKIPKKKVIQLGIEAAYKIIID